MHSWEVLLKECEPPGMVGHVTANHANQAIIYGRSGLPRASHQAEGRAA
jgi:hypothetical protein